MTISLIFRTLASFLSFWHLNKAVSEKKDLNIRKKILQKIDNIKIKNKSLKKTHQKFNREISSLLKSENLKNFLRKNFIQKMFFLQNRIFILKELNEIKKSKKWKIYKKLLIEDPVGNPIRYFLYSKSSGNRINHVYHLSVIENELKINLSKNIKTVFEFGAGYGCMARIFSKLSKKIKYICYDTDYVNLLQFYYLKHNNLNVGFNKNNKFYLTSNLKKSRNNNDLFIANWSLSETPINFRNKFFKVLSSSKYILICFQENFENIDNLKYFNLLKKKLSSKFKIVIKKNRFYKGNIFYKQNHYFFIGKKL
tara:strand:+ start:51 stop:980 length:930 start_codon:yes stop_codon:yes gene_type:complete